MERFRIPFVLLLAVALVVAACSDDDHASEEPGEATEERTTITDGTTTTEAEDDRSEVAATGPDAEQSGELSDADAENIVNGFLRLADHPGADAVDRLPFAEEVRLGLGSELHQARNRAQLADPEAWIIDEDEFRAYSGPFSALDVGARAESTVVSVGEHPHCVNPPVPPPDDLADHDRVSVQPVMDEQDSCLQWWTVDLFLDETGQIEAITLDLWEP
jgi:hypothetical protein